MIVVKVEQGMPVVKIVEGMSVVQAVDYAIYAAKQVIRVFERKYRKAQVVQDLKACLEAAEICQADPSPESRRSAKDSAEAADIIAYACEQAEDARETGGGEAAGYSAYAVAYAVAFAALSAQSQNVSDARAYAAAAAYAACLSLDWEAKASELATSEAFSIWRDEPHRIDSNTAADCNIKAHEVHAQNQVTKKEILHYAISKTNQGTKDGGEHHG